jgi:citrate lyase alpha subunit
MEVFKKTQKVGEESVTSEVFVDANGKAWPIYKKIIDMGAGPNAAADSVAYAAADIVKADGYFKAHGFYTKAATAPVIADGAALIVTMTLTNVVLTSTADLTAYTGRAEVYYCKAAD